MDDITQTWVKILFAYGPLGVLVAAMIYGLWKAAHWSAENVVKPVVAEHLRMLVSIRTTNETNAQTLLELKNLHKAAMEKLQS